MSDAKKLSDIKESGASLASKNNFHLVDEPEYSLSNDLLEGAHAISTWLWGAPLTRKLYHLAETSNSLPVTRVIGSRITARKSIIRAAFWAQERRAFSDEKEEELVQLGVLLIRLIALIRGANRTTTVPGADSAQLHLWFTTLNETVKAVDRILNNK
jgi:hypothetical protein